MLGSAVLTTAMSSMSIAVARHTTPSVTRRIVCIGACPFSSPRGMTRRMANRCPRNDAAGWRSVCGVIRPSQVSRPPLAAPQSTLHQAVPVAGSVLAGERQAAEGALQLFVVHRAGDRARGVGAARPGIVVPGHVQRLVAVEVEIGA